MATRGLASTVSSMTSMATLATFVLLAAILSAVGFACGSQQDTAGIVARAGGDGGGGSLFGEGGPLVGDAGNVTSLVVTPSTASLVTSGAPVAQQFKAVATLANGSTVDVTSGASWGWDDPGVGAVDASGLYTANGSLGGVVQITAAVGARTATAVLTVALHLPPSTGGVSSGTQGTLLGAANPDANVVLAYPYDTTLFPRGVGAAPLMWQGGASSDVYLAHLSSPTFDYQAFFTAAGARYDFDAQAWQQFADSTSGAAEMKLARWDGTQATVVADQHWTIAPGSMRGTVYYWSVNDESVMRIAAGAASPVNFLDSSGPAEDHAPYCPSCHTVSANGGHLVMNEGTWGAQPSPVEQSYDYDLVAGTSAGPFVPNTDTSVCESSGCPSEWGLAAVSPDGTTIVENFANLRGQIGRHAGAFDSMTAQALPNTGLENAPLCMPAFSPDGLLLAYVDCGTMDLRAYDWDPVHKVASNDRLLSASSQNATWPQIQYPTVSPDHAWVVYARGPSLGSLGNPGDLYVAPVATPSPNGEVALAALNGETYPFAAGARDRDLNFEPTFAPVASGGYFWIVFHSRRTWGNALVGPAFVMEGTGVKQLWVAAFDQAPKAGADPSHTPFHLPGQGTTVSGGMDPINMRGFWALSPCHSDGQGCASGTDCCGGFCLASGDGGLSCASNSPGCSKDGDRCATAADCCSATDRCINGYCAQQVAQ